MISSSSSATEENRLEKSEYEDHIRNKPVLSKSIDREEYFLLDQNTLWYFPLIDKEPFDLQDTIDAMIEDQKTKNKKINKKRIVKAMTLNFEEINNVEMVEKQGDKYVFDPIYTQIINLLKNEPKGKKFIGEQFIAEKIDVEGYLRKLYVAGYIGKTWDLYRDENYRRVMEQMLHYPKTIKELVVDYNRDLTIKNQKSENTIYRYVKNLIMAGLAINAGQRVIFGKRSTENLYSSSSYVFIVQDYTSHTWASEFGYNVGSLITSLFKIIKPEINTDAKCIQKILVNISNHLDSLSEEIIEQSEGMIEDLEKYSMGEIGAGFRNAALILWLIKNPQQMDDLLSCLEQE